MTPTAATLIYGLCLVTCLICAGLLVRAYLRSKAKLLMWSALCFGLLSLNNVAVVLDILILPGVDLMWARQASSLAAVGVLLYGFIWEAE